MHPASLLSYYPSYSILDEVISGNDCKTLNIYIDLKNNLQTIYMEHAILNIVESSLGTKRFDTSVFSSILSFLSFHKIYAVKRNININVYIFLESGISYYHKNISKKYKISRKIDDLYGLDRDKRDLFFQVLHSNFLLSEKVFNKIPNIKFIRLPNLEADFVPYYLMTRNLVEDGDDIYHLVYSNDHDLFQCVKQNCSVFSKVPKHKKLVKCGKVMSSFLHVDTHIPDEFLPLAMSIIGDSGDDVYGVKGIGSKRFISIFDDLLKLSGNMNTIYDKVRNNEIIFNIDSSNELNKYLSIVINEEIKNSTISNNLKLVSFELLSRELDDPSSTEILDKKKHIQNILSDNSIANKESMKLALQRSGIIIGEDIDVLYFSN